MYMISKNLRLALKVLHDVQEMIVNIWLVLELDLHCVEIAEGVGDVERPVWLFHG